MSPVSLDASRLSSALARHQGGFAYATGTATFGGVAYISGTGKVDFEGCNFKNNYASELGGVAYVEGEASFKRCTYNGNGAGCSGYEIFQAEGGKASADNAVIGTVNYCLAFGLGYGLGIPVLFACLYCLVIAGCKPEAQGSTCAAGTGFITVLAGFSLFVADWGGASAPGLEIAGGLLVVCGVGGLIGLWLLRKTRKYQEVSSTSVKHGG